MQFVNQARAQIVPDRTNPTSKADVAATRGGRCFLQCGVNAFRDKPKLRTALHPERRSRIMRQHEDGRVVRRLLPPPALPAVIRPRPSDRTEHVASENPGPDSAEAFLRNCVVDARLAIRMAVHLPPDTRVKKPVHQLRAADA